MRLTNRLYAQHLGWWFKKKWQYQGQRKIEDTGAQEILEKLGKPVVDALQVAKPKPVFQRIELDSFNPKVAEDHTHPNWHDEICHIYGDGNVLLEGTPQAQVLTKTVALQELPKNLEESISSTKIANQTDKNIQNSILASHVFDAEQEKLAIVKIPERPSFVLPRIYGITDGKRNRLIISKLLFECEKLAGRSITAQRRIVNDAKFCIYFEKDGDKLQFDLTADTFMISKRPLEPVRAKYAGELPDLYPIKHTITIPQKNIYTIRNSYPISNGTSLSHPHTIFLHYSPLDVRNLYESPVTETQFEARTLLKAFTAASSRARQLYGENVKSLPHPVVVQSIQTDGRRFHFGVYQLNTLDLNGSDGTKNYWLNKPTLELFSECSYKVGRPVLEGYNKEVFRYVFAFYNNC